MTKDEERKGMQSRGGRDAVRSGRRGRERIQVREVLVALATPH